MITKIKLSATVEYEDKQYSELVCDFDGLSGKDYMDIRREIANSGNIVLVPEFDSELLLHITAKAAKVDFGIMEQLGFKDAMSAEKAARRFLSRSSAKEEAPTETK